MAETNSSLGFSSKLQIIVVPSDKTYNTPATKTGLLIFREGTNIIEVNGHKYQATSSADLTAITNALKNTGYLTESGGVLTTAKAPGTVAALLGTKIATSGDGKKTVSDWIDDILGKISGINTNISNLQSLTNTEGTGAFVVRKSGDGETDFATTTAIQKAITDAKTAAINAAKKDASEKDTQVKKDLIGDGKDSTESSSTPLKPGKDNTWALSEKGQKNLSHLKDLILNLQGQLNTLTTSDLKGVTDAINAIEKELVDGGSGLTTIIDGLKVFLGSGLNASGATHTVGGASSTYTLQQIIDALETEIKARIASVGKADGETLIDVTTDSNKAVTVYSTTSLQTAVTNANSAIQSVNKASTEDLISVSTNTNTKAVTVSSTTALQTAVNNANAALPKGSDSPYKSAVDLANKLKGNSSTDTSDSKTIEGTRKYAEKTAKTYADSVITWTVIS